MAYDIVLGRSESDRLKLKDQGTIFLGKQYVQMGQTTSLANKIFMDITRSHVVFIVGKRGSGKSYSLGVVAEGITDLDPNVSKNLSVIILDTMGIYWTMKYPNHKDEQLLNDWGLKGKALNISIFTPKGYYNRYKQEGIPTDYPFTIKPSELTSSDWHMIFGVHPTEQLGVLIEWTINELKEKNIDYSIEDIISVISKNSDVDTHVKTAAITYFKNTEHWGLFDKDSTPLDSLAIPGKVVVLDVSCYATQSNGWAIKSIVIGLLSQKLFMHRMQIRKEEEIKDIETAEHFFSKEKESVQKYPLVWIMIDEAHEFLPNKGKTPATDALVTILREGRQPGISLILATQQPAKIHSDVMTQADIIIAHTVTAKIDTDALGNLMQSYMRQGLDKELSILPKINGAAILIDDQNERLYISRIRPRFTWHGGESPTALKKAKDLFSF